MRFLFIEPFFGGSHRDFAQGLATHSAHRIDVVHLPARFWKWRMRGAALHFFRLIDNLAAYDGIIASSLMSLSDFTALCGGRRPPTLVYFHENQLNYPLSPGERMDLQFGFTDITTALCADRILFNSRYHFDSFFDTLPGFISRMPEFKPLWAVDAIREKSGVLHPGCDFGSAPLEPLPRPPGPPIVIWNHRWEFDKNPDAFFGALDRMRRLEIDFRLVIMGENYRMTPRAFAEARDRLGDKILHYGYAADKTVYRKWLKKGHVAISTAFQENFGIAMVEAMRFGCLPLLPRRLAYPEVLPREFHMDFLYRDDAELVEKLAVLLRRPQQLAQHRPVLADMMERYGWPAVIDHYDRELESLADLSA